MRVEKVALQVPQGTEGKPGGVVVAGGVAVPKCCRYPIVTAWQGRQTSVVFYKMRYMILDVTPFQPDVGKIYALIHVWDHRCKHGDYRDCPRKRGPVTRFAQLIGCSRQSLYNLRAPGKRLGYAFALQIAAALHAQVDDIRLTPATETPRPRAGASAA